MQIDEYTEWLERKVQASLDGLADGSNRTFSAAEWDAIRAKVQASERHFSSYTIRKT